MLAELRQDINLGDSTMGELSSRPGIVNPLTGEHITILEAGTGGDVLIWELLLAPGGRVPSAHIHPQQEECFTVKEGRMRFRVGRRTITAEPGDTVVVPPRKAHHFSNPGPAAVRAEVRTSPALDMAELLETAAAIAREQLAAGRVLPRLGVMALFMRDFETEVAAPFAPGLVRRAARGLAAAAERRGPGLRYRALRGNGGNHAFR
jgi:mannose-6-phosphate isomerase-like protein (cupin superfamily)